MIVHARMSHNHTQEVSAGIAMLRGLAGVVATLSVASASAAAADEAGLVAVAQAHKTVVVRHAAVAAGPALRLTSDAPPAWFLERARSSIQANRINVAKEALERAETRLLDDRASALYAIDDALAALTVPARAVPIRQGVATSASTPAATIATPLPVSPAPPVSKFVLLPGHWQLDGYRYVWVKGDETLRPVEARRFAQGRYVWRDRAWVWVPDHFE